MPRRGCRLAIVDGILGMEGNGPIQGTPKPAGVLLFGDDPVAVDATGCRVMGLLPGKGGLPGPGRRPCWATWKPVRFQQLGEGVESLRTRFAVLPEFSKLVA